MNIILKNCGDEFDMLLDRWNAMEPGEARDDLCDMLNERADAIRLMPVADLGDLAVKARAVAWTTNVDFDPPDEDDYFSFLMAGFIREVAKVGAARSLAG